MSSSTTDFPEHARKVFENLNMQRYYGAFCDVTVRVTGVDWKLHKCILAGSSEKGTTVLTIKDVTAAGFRIIVNYIYTGLVFLDDAPVDEVLKCAQTLEIRDVEKACVEFSNGIKSTNRYVNPDTPLTPLGGDMEASVAGLDDMIPVTPEPPSPTCPQLDNRGLDPNLDSHRTTSVPSFDPYFDLYTEGIPLKNPVSAPRGYEHNSLYNQGSCLDPCDLNNDLNLNFDPMVYGEFQSLPLNRELDAGMCGSSYRQEMESVAKHLSEHMEPSNKADVGRDIGSKDDALKTSQLNKKNDTEAMLCERGGFDEDQYFLCLRRPDDFIQQPNNSCWLPSQQQNSSTLSTTSLQQPLLEESTNHPPFSKLRREDRPMESLSSLQHVYVEKPASSERKEKETPSEFSCESEPYLTTEINFPPKHQRKLELTYDSGVRVQRPDVGKSKTDSMANFIMTSRQKCEMEKTDNTLLAINHMSVEKVPETTGPASPISLPMTSDENASKSREVIKRPASDVAKPVAHTPKKRRLESFIEFESRSPSTSHDRNSIIPGKAKTAITFSSSMSPSTATSFLSANSTAMPTQNSLVMNEMRYLSELMNADSDRNRETRKQSKILLQPFEPTCALEPLPPSTTESCMTSSATRLDNGASSKILLSFLRSSSAGGEPPCSNTLDGPVLPVSSKAAHSTVTVSSLPSVISSSSYSSSALCADNSPQARSIGSAGAQSAVTSPPRSSVPVAVDTSTIEDYLKLIESMQSDNNASQTVSMASSYDEFSDIHTEPVLSKSLYSASVEAVRRKVLNVLSQERFDDMPIQSGPKALGSSSAEVDVVDVEAVAAVTSQLPAGATSASSDVSKPVQLDAQWSGMHGVQSSAQPADDDDAADFDDVALSPKDDEHSRSTMFDLVKQRVVEVSKTPRRKNKNPVKLSMKFARRAMQEKNFATTDTEVTSSPFCDLAFTLPLTESRSCVSEAIIHTKDAANEASFMDSELVANSNKFNALHVDEEHNDEDDVGDAVDEDVKDSVVRMCSGDQCAIDEELQAEAQAIHDKLQEWVDTPMTDVLASPIVAGPCDDLSLQAPPTPLVATRNKRKNSVPQHKPKSTPRCDKCGRSFTKYSTLRNHLRLHQQQPLGASCDVCGMVFQRAAELTKHRQSHGDQSWRCRDCDEVLPNSKLFKLHMAKKHQNDKPFYCDHGGCTFSASKQCNLERHKLLHSEVKMFKCPTCNKQFSQPNGLRSHANSCTQARTYKCDLCPQSFNQPHALKVHKFVHSGEKPYSCEQCEATFSDKRNFKRHLRIHLNIFPYTCPVCDRSFRHSNSLKSHIKVMHKDPSRNKEQPAKFPLPVKVKVTQEDRTKVLVKSGDASVTVVIGPKQKGKRSSSNN